MITSVAVSFDSGYDMGNVVRVNFTVTPIYHDSDYDFKICDTLTSVYCDSLNFEYFECTDCE